MKKLLSLALLGTLSLALGGCNQAGKSAYMPGDTSTQTRAVSVDVAVPDTSKPSSQMEAMAGMLESQGVTSSYSLTYTTTSDMPEPLNTINVITYSFKDTSTAEAFLNAGSSSGEILENIADQAFSTGESNVTLRVGADVIQIVAFDGEADTKKFAADYANWMTSAE